MIKYFAYGSNMSPSRLIERDVKYQNRQKGVLRGYRFIINKKSYKNPSIGFANIIEDEHSIVEGVLYDVENSEIEKLDIFEGFPKHYNRIKVYIEVDGYFHEAITYIGNSNYTSQNWLPTTDEYKSKIMSGCDLLSESYSKNLDKNIFLI